MMMGRAGGRGERELVVLLRERVIVGAGGW